MFSPSITLLILLFLLPSSHQFVPRPFLPRPPLSLSLSSEPPTSEASEATSDLTSKQDAEMTRQEEALKRVAELKSQEVFIKRSTGVFKCQNCNYEYKESEGDQMMIGGVNPPGTSFSSLASNYRCPTCRASKDSFQEVVEEIAGFEVNQGYGFGTNSMTGGQKNALIFGGLAAFFVLFLAGYGMS
mmetsp:Transcript_25391/g.47716  ORF Transcript_25391/g.47716 Transcript_25391/m.47716 type:complete len:186 (+) Transcript_25391:68-625(+)